MKRCYKIIVDLFHGWGLGILIKCTITVCNGSLMKSGLFKMSIIINAPSTEWKESKEYIELGLATKTNLLDE